MSRLRLNALWVGNELSYLERLSLASALNVGHPVTLYTYGRVDNVPDGVEVRDGSEIMPFERMIRHEKSGSYALGSNIFRMLLLKQGKGCYIDCDLLFLRPLADEDHIFGWETDGSINGAILKLPSNSPVIDDILAYVDSRPLIAPWWSWTRRLRQRLAWLIGNDRALSTLKWGSAGPRALSYFTRKRGIEGLAKTVDVFYPNPYEAAMDVFDPKCDLRTQITDKTVTVHLWHEQIKACRNFMPLPGSFIFEQCERLGISDPRWHRLASTAVA